MGALRRPNVLKEAPREGAPRMQYGPEADASGPYGPACATNNIPGPYWQVVVKLSGSATTVTPRMVAPTSTSWPF